MMFEHNSISNTAIEALSQGLHPAPFDLLGMHKTEGGAITVRAFVPNASMVSVINYADDTEVATLTRLHPAGFFAGVLINTTQAFPYRLRIYHSDGSWHEQDDPYRFSLTIYEQDVKGLHAGQHPAMHHILGAHIQQIEGISGTRFAVWAPNALRVSLVGDFNHWDGRVHPMRKHESTGIWQLFLPNCPLGTHYKYEVLDAHGHLLPLKADPFGFSAQVRPDNASIVAEPPRLHPLPSLERRQAQRTQAPISIYEVHLGSWQRTEDGGFLNYREIAQRLIPYVKDLGFTHIELLPITEHPYDGSWGYQPVGLYAPTSRFGSAQDFQFLVDTAHAENISVILDWVPAHFPTDGHGLGLFDGTHLYEHADPRRGFHQDWNTLIYNYGRNEVRNFLIDNALYWLERFDLDGLRVDAVASMLYNDYSRKDGEWLPNQYGGRENLEAIAFIKELNNTVRQRRPNAIIIAEESTAWPKVSHPTEDGGLGFHYKWNMGWMHDTLEYMKKDPAYRKYHHDQMTFGLVYAFNENFILPLSHDEVVHGKASILGKMPGNKTEKFANLRAYYGFMWTHPGKKLLFMGDEIAQEREWNEHATLDWFVLQHPEHQGVQRWIKALNHLYIQHPALHQRDHRAEGFSWVNHTDSELSVLSYQRHGNTGERLLVVCNMTPIPRSAYNLPLADTNGHWQLLLNSDDSAFGGYHSPVQHTLHAHENGTPCNLPSLSTLIYEWHPYHSS